MVHLIVAEKPSVARDIARVFKVKNKRNGYFESERVWVTWCFGHMVQLAEPAAYNEAWGKWRKDQLPMVPEEFQLKPIASSRDQLKVLRSLLKHKDVTTIVNACDAGREGELIFRYVYDLVGAKKPVKRAWLASMTDEAVRKAFKDLRDGEEYDALGDAARCRSEADWLVGLNATRAMTLQCRAAGARDALMSVGRVQTPTLAMIVRREREIEAFDPKDFWQVYATFDAGPQQDTELPQTYEGLWTKQRVDRFEDQAKAQAVIDAVHGQTGEVSKVHHKDVRERPPMLYDLTSLQRAANQRYGYSAQDTLQVAQSLYEKHKLLTYPRTDSNHLTSDMKKNLPDVVDALTLEPYEAFCEDINHKPLKFSKRIVDDKEVGDHHAIIPTNRRPNLNKLSDRERNVYDMVARRFLAVFHEDAIFATSTIETKVKTHTFSTKGRVRRQAGWQVVDPPSKDARAQNAAQKTKGKKKGKTQPMLPHVQKAQQVPVDSERLHKGRTSPPKRYNEASLLGGMERAGAQVDDAALKRALKASGIGTPATRASVIETLLKREFIRRDRKNLIPTDRGCALIDALTMDVLKSPELTGQWEAKLTKVAQGELPRAQFMKEVRALTAQVTDTIFAQMPNISQTLSDAEILGTCPICKTPVTEGFKAYSCGGGRDCSFVVFKTIAGRKTSKGLVKLLLAGKTSQPLKGFKSKKTKKTFEAALKLDEEGRASFVFDRQRQDNAPTPRAPAKAKAEPKPKATKPTTKAAPSAPNILEQTCPQCQEGHLIRGRKGWGCSQWKSGCGFVLWFELEGHLLSNTQAVRLVQGHTLDDLPPHVGAARLKLGALNNIQKVAT